MQRVAPSNITAARRAATALFSRSRRPEMRSTPFGRTISRFSRAWR